MSSAQDPDAGEARLYRRLEALGAATTTHAHAPVFTVEEARALRGDLPGDHCKCLFLIDRKGALFLVVAREAAAIDLKGLGATLGAARLSFGKPDLLRQVLGVKPGAVTPFALMNDEAHLVRPVIDAALMAAARVNFHPLRNDRTVGIAPRDLIRFIADCGHQPLILRLAP
jgi:Ala-tRNA(Pro) deacylase